MVEVKICGLTRPGDAVVAAELGANYLGLVFAPSRRQVTLRQAAEIRAALGAATALIGVFVDPTGDEVRRAVEAAGLSGVQLHGNAPEPAALEGLSWWRGARVRPDGALEGVVEGVWELLLLDTWVDGQAGGTGRTFDWHGARAAVAAWRRGAGTARVGVAGGLTAPNVAAAIEALRPDLVDVSSGVETAPGLKDRRRMEEFVRAVRAAGGAA